MQVHGIPVMIGTAPDPDKRPSHHPNRFKQRSPAFGQRRSSGWRF
jgi:hypothetical protein